MSTEMQKECTVCSTLAALPVGLVQIELRTYMYIYMYIYTAAKTAVCCLQ